MRYNHIGAYFAAAAAVIGLCFGGYFAYWAIAGDSQDRRNHVNTHSQQYQAGLISQERDRADAYDTLTSTIAAEKDAVAKQADRVQQIHIKQEFCQVYPDITDVPNDLSQAHSRIC